jgi:hypothetical protein
MMNIDKLIYNTTEVIKKYEMDGDTNLINLYFVFDYYKNR